LKPDGHDAYRVSQTTEEEEEGEAAPDEERDVDQLLAELVIDGTEDTPPDQLCVDGDNPNEQAEETFGHLVEGLRSAWVGGPIVANTGDLPGYGGDTDVEGLICDGEHRWRAAKEVGLEEVPVRFVDFEDDAQRRYWRQHLNKVTGEHDTTRDALEYDYLLGSGYTQQVEAVSTAADEDLDELLDEIRVDTDQQVGYEYETSEEIYYEDAVDGIAERIEDDAVDAVITDPPYGIDLDLTGTIGSEDVQHSGSVENDGHDEAIELWRATVTELKRVLAPDGHLYAFCSWKTYDEFRDILASAGFEVLNCIVWCKSTPNNQTTFGSGGVRYGYQHEFVLYAVHETAEARPLDRTLSDLVLHKHSTEGNDHPTEKPVGLIETLIEQSSDPDDTVLDPFLGSGSTAVAAIESGRHPIGFEIEEEEYQPVIERRVAEAKRATGAIVNSAGGGDNGDEDAEDDDG